jgi:uncharacterized membrane protein
MNVSAITVPAATSNWKRVGWVLLFLLGLFAAGHAVMFLFVDGHGSSEIKERFMGTAIAGYAHGFGGAIAALLGPFQLISSIRRTSPRVHVWIGRTYLLAVLAGGLAGLYFGPQTSAGPIAATGFTTLAVFWLYSGTQAYITIRRGDVQAHRRWMLRNFSLTLAAAMLRVELPLLIVLGGFSFSTAYIVVAWSSWVPNWLIVEAWLRRGRAVTR